MVPTSLGSYIMHMQYCKMKVDWPGQMGKGTEYRFRFLLSMLKFLMHQKAKDFLKVEVNCFIYV